MAAHPTRATCTARMVLTITLVLGRSAGGCAGQELMSLQSKSHRHTPAAHARASATPVAGRTAG